MIRCPECGSWDSKCQSEHPVKSCSCRRCLLEQTARLKKEVNALESRELNANVDLNLDLEKAQAEITRLENEALDFITKLRRKVEDNARLRDSTLVWKVEALRMGTEVTRLTGIIDEVLGLFRAPDSTNDGGPADVVEEVKNCIHNYEVMLNQMTDEKERLREGVVGWKGEAHRVEAVVAELTNAITDLLEDAEEYLDVIGECDHDVGICVCRTRRNCKKARHLLELPERWSTQDSPEGEEP